MFLGTTKKVPFLHIGASAKFDIPANAEIRYFGDKAPVVTLKRDSSGNRGSSELPENSALIISDKEGGGILSVHVCAKNQQQVVNRFSKNTQIFGLATLPDSSLSLAAAQTAAV